MISEPAPASRRDIKSLTREQLLAWLNERGVRSFRADQILTWLYGRHVDTFEEMTDLRKDFRLLLGRYFTIDRLALERVQDSSDGSRKYLFGLTDGNAVETVLIPERNHSTLCVSSQVGCAQGCRFCRTGGSGLTRNLRFAEIVSQVSQVRRTLPDPDHLTNIVFMGMGEPLANYAELIRALEVLTHSQWGMRFAARRITVSTAGLVPHMADLGRDTKVNLAVSLNAADDETRNRLMPINRRYPLARLIDACRSYRLPTGRKITFEYILIRGVNDSLGDARRLVKLLTPVKAKVNLIPFNEHPGCEFRRPDDRTIQAFQDFLIGKHMTSIIRHSKGRDIAAACGQLNAQRQAESSGMSG